MTTSERIRITAERLLGKMPSLVITGEEAAVDLILYEVLNLVIDSVQADIGQINLLPKGGRVEKVCVIKDHTPWPHQDRDMPLFEPFKGFSGLAIRIGRTILVEDIWAPAHEGRENPFLELLPEMDPQYVEEIKRPVHSTIISPIKKGDEINSIVELARYNHRPPFNLAEKEMVEEFCQQYGALIVDYILDVKNRIAIQTAHKKLLALGRLLASEADWDYRDAIEAYKTLSASNIGFCFIKSGGLQASSFRLVIWNRDEVREVFLPDFSLSSDSILKHDPEMVFPLEGEARDRRLIRFHDRIQNSPGLKAADREFILEAIDDIRSYVAYSLQLLSQDLGAVVLGSHRPRFWAFLRMNPFLSLYNTLLKSFLLNERLIHQLNVMSMKIHNPGFYCLGNMKAALGYGRPGVCLDPRFDEAVKGLEKLLEDLHQQGKMIRATDRKIPLVNWLEAYFNQVRQDKPGLKVDLLIKGKNIRSCLIRGADDKLETIFDNLVTNSLRAIRERRRQEADLIGRIVIKINVDNGMIKLKIQDNGMAYGTISGRGLPQIHRQMISINGKIKILTTPYRVFLQLPTC